MAAKHGPGLGNSSHAAGALSHEDADTATKIKSITPEEV